MDKLQNGCYKCLHLDAFYEFATCTLQLRPAVARLSLSIVIALGSNGSATYLHTLEPLCYAVEL